MMKILNSQKTKKTLLVEQLDDLWYLSQIIEPHDILRTKTERKLKIGEDKIVKKTLVLSLEVTKTELTPESLRVSGIVSEGTQDVPKGVHHTFSITQGSRIDLEKTQWLNYHEEYLNEATQPPKSKRLLCVLDRDEAHFALLGPKGIERISDMRGSVNKKGYDGQAEGDFYASVAKRIEEYLERYEAPLCILSSPAFFKDEVYKKISQEHKKRIITTASNTGNPQAFSEILKKNEVRSALVDDANTQDLTLIEQVLERIAKDGAVAYGFEEVQNAAQVGAIETLLIANSYLEQAKEEGTFSQLYELMKQASHMRAKVHLVNSENDAGKQLLGLGGVAALLRYKL